MSDDFPAAPRLGRPTASPRRRNQLSRESIVEAALAIVDREGVDAASMRRVAEAVGTGPASLYAHVESKEVLLDLIFDRVIGEMQLDEPHPPDQWQEELKSLIREARRVMTAHGDIARATIGRVPMGPNGLRVNENFVRILRAAGLSPRVVGLAPDLLALYMTAVSVEEGLVTTLGLTPEQVGAYYDEVQAFYTNLPAQTYPNLAASADLVTGYNEGDQRFEFGLDVLVSGLSAVAEKDRAS